MRKLKLILTFFTLFLSFHSRAQQTAIELSNEKSDLRTDGFLIKIVRDARKDTTYNGYTLSATKKKELIRFNGGVASTLLSYLRNNNIAQDSQGTPVELVILKLEIEEKKKRGAIVADIVISYGFRIEGEQQYALTTEVRTTGGKNALEKSLRSQTEKMITKFDRWFAENKDDVLARPGVILNLIVNTSAKDQKHIMYSKKRKLTYGDFQHRPKKMSKFAAATASGIYMEFSAITIKKKTIIKAKIGGGFSKKDSWFKKNYKTKYVLDHEQLHYDITGYWACEMIKRVRSFNFTQESFEKEFKQLHKEYNALLDKMQDEYDSQTNHGLVKEKQAEWRAKINTLLAAQDCYDDFQK